MNPNQNQGKPNPGNRQPKTTLKFENDYDFEQANNKFEEMRSEIAKLKVGDEVKPEQVFTLSIIILFMFLYVCLSSDSFVEE